MNVWMDEQMNEWTNEWMNTLTRGSYEHPIWAGDAHKTVELNAWPEEAMNIQSELEMHTKL